MIFDHSRSKSHASGADDARAVGRRAPEDGLVDPVGFAHEGGAEAEGVEHLDGAAGDAIGLADLQRAVALIDDAGGDAGEGRELGGEQQSGRAGCCRGAQLRLCIPPTVIQ